MSPTITVASFFSSDNVCVSYTFYRITKLLDRKAETHLDYCKRSPLFKTGRDYRPPLFYSTLCDFFCLERAPFKHWSFKKPKESPFYIFRHYETFKILFQSEIGYLNIDPQIIFFFNTFLNCAVISGVKRLSEL